jgi:hypothetical protein
MTGRRSQPNRATLVVPGPGGGYGALVTAYDPPEPAPPGAASRETGSLVGWQVTLKDLADDVIDNRLIFIKTGGPGKSSFPEEVARRYMWFIGDALRKGLRPEPGWPESLPIVQLAIRGAGDPDVREAALRLLSDPAALTVLMRAADAAPKPPQPTSGKITAKQQLVAASAVLIAAGIAVPTIDPSGGAPQQALGNVFAALAIIVALAAILLQRQSS